MENNEWTYQIRMNDSFNNGHQDRDCRQSRGFQSLKDLINTSNAEDLPFTAEDFPSLSKNSAKGCLHPRSEKIWATGWANQRNKDEQNSNQVQQLGTNPGQIEEHQQIGFQWRENDLVNAVSIPKEFEPLPKMKQTNPGQIEEHQHISFQWLPNTINIPKEFEHMPKMNQTEYRMFLRKQKGIEMQNCKKFPNLRT